MNPRNFDELTKTLATSTSRQALKTLFASAVAGVFGLGQTDAVLAEPEPGCSPAGHSCNGRVSNRRDGNQPSLRQKRSRHSGSLRFFLPQEKTSNTLKKHLTQ